MYPSQSLWDMPRHSSWFQEGLDQPCLPLQDHRALPFWSAGGIQTLPQPVWNHMLSRQHAAPTPGLVTLNAWKFLEAEKGYGITWLHSLRRFRISKIGQFEKWVWGKTFKDVFIDHLSDFRHIFFLYFPIFLFFSHFRESNTLESNCQEHIKDFLWLNKIQNTK